MTLRKMLVMPLLREDAGADGLSNDAEGKDGVGDSIREAVETGHHV